MSLDLSSLTTYVEENKSDLIEKAVLGSRTAGLVDVRTGIKSSENLPILESTVPFQSASSCGFTSSGTTSITPVNIATTPIAVAESICLQDLETYFTQKWLPSGANNDSTAIAEAIANRKVANINQRVEQAIWQSKTTYTNATQLKHFNGLISLIDSGSPVSATSSTMNESNVLTILNNVHENIPAAAHWNEEIVIFVGMDVFKLAIQKITSTNYFHYDSDKAARNWEFTLPGTTAKVIAVPGLNNDNPVDSGSLPTAVQQRVIATYKSNIVVGTDLQNDWEELEMWYSKDDRLLKFYTRFRLGVQIKFMDHVVEYTNS